MVESHRQETSDSFRRRQSFQTSLCMKNVYWTKGQVKFEEFTILFPSQSHSYIAAGSRGAEGAAAQPEKSPHKNI